MPLVDWDAWNTWNRFAEDPITYEHPEIDLGAILTFTPLVTVTGTGTPTVYESHSDDDVTYTNFAQITGQISARYLKIKVMMTDPTEAIIEEVTIIADATALIEDQTDVDSSTLTGTTGDRRLSLVKTFSVITSVNLALQNVGAGWSWEVIDKSVVSGPRIKIYNATDTLADATFDAVIRGIA